MSHGCVGYVPRRLALVRSPWQRTHRREADTSPGVVKGRWAEQMLGHSTHSDYSVGDIRVFPCVEDKGS
jgi:hypothetical protein